MLRNSVHDSILRRVAIEWRKRRHPDGKRILFGAYRKQHYRWVYIGSIVVASVVTLETAIGIIDGAFALMAIPTMISTLLLAPKDKEAVKRYFARIDDPSSTR